MKSNYPDGGKKNLVLAVICLLLFILFAALLLWNRRTESVQQKALEALAAREESGDREEERGSAGDTRDQEDAGEGSGETSAGEKAPETQPEQSEEPQTEASREEGEEETEETDSVPALATGIVCWGDDLINGEESAQYSYRAVLQNLLNDSGYNLTVIDKTLQGAGTLSMMTMAGVPREEVQSYITAHREAARGGELPVTETGIRDLTAEQLERNDLDCVPVIFMGYYGGWNHDPAELVRQQEAILNTFPQQEQYIIAGTFPLDGSVDSATLDSVMREKWGDHYISLAAVTSSPSATYEAQEALAQAILQKMKELGYLV